MREIGVGGLWRAAMKAEAGTGSGSMMTGH